MRETFVTDFAICS